jgi:hypothetical protein
MSTTLLLESAQRALGALRSSGIAAIPFKGVALLQGGVYTDPGARSLEDADVLVDPADAPRAVRVLAEAGFEPWRPWEPSLMEWLSAFSFSEVGAPGGVVASLDLHWATPYTQLRQSPPWRRDALWPPDGGDLPGPEAHFVLLCEHFLKHLRVVPHLRGIADLARVVPTIRDGDAVARVARERRSLPGVRAMTTLLRAHLRVDGSDDVARAVGAPPALSGRAERALHPANLLRGSEGEGRGVLGMFGSWWLMGSTADSLQEWLRVAVPGADWLRARYPAPGALPRRVRYLLQTSLWAAGRGPSPLSPNQDAGP